MYNSVNVNVITIGQVHHVINDLVCYEHYEDIVLRIKKGMLIMIVAETAPVRDMPNVLFVTILYNGRMCFIRRSYVESVELFQLFLAAEK